MDEPFIVVVTLSAVVAGILFLTGWESNLQWKAIDDFGTDLDDLCAELKGAGYTVVLQFTRNEKGDSIASPVIIEDSSQKKVAAGELTFCHSFIDKWGGEWGEEFDDLLYSAAAYFRETRQNGQNPQAHAA